MVKLLEMIRETYPDTPTGQRSVAFLTALMKDKTFKALGLDAAAYTTPEQVVDVLLEHPKLMQRPIVIRGERAVIARPSDKVEELLE